MALTHASALTVPLAHSNARAAPPRSALPQSFGSLWEHLPSWEGAPGYDLAVRASEDTLSQPPVARTSEGVDVIGGADLAAFLALGTVVTARPVYVGAAQLAALPPWSEGEHWDRLATGLRFAEHVHLPFDTLLLDFTEAGGDPCWITGGQRDYALYSALLFRPADDVPGALVRTGELAIVPFGSATRSGGLVQRAMALRDGAAMAPAAPLGVLIVGGRRAQPELCRGESGYSGMLSSDPDKRMQTIACTIPAELAADPLGRTRRRPFPTAARICAGSGALTAELLPAAPSAIGATTLECLQPRFRDTVQRAVGESHAVLSMALSALRAMYLLDSTNIELAPAALSRQVRRAVERSDGRRQIALTVRVRTRRRESAARSKPAGKRTFSHSFERGGAYRHVTRGPQAKPEHLRPCPKQDEAHERSGGVCRRYWVSSCVIDAGEGKPFIPKTRRIV